MEAIRQIKKVTSNKVTITLPSDFSAERVEIIIFPVDDSEKKIQNLQNLLLKAPTLTDIELQEFQKVREAMNQWAVKEF